MKSLKRRRSNLALKSTKDLELRITAKNETSGAFNKVADDVKNFAQGIKNASNSQGGLINSLKNGWNSLPSVINSVGSAFGSVFSSISNYLVNTISNIFSLRTAIHALEIGVGLIQGFININSEFEKMKVTMDVVTHGQGEAWFNKLNNWALNMPVSMAEVSKAFTVLNAYSLTPSIKLMENLINVASVLPDSGKAIIGISRAMGQIQTKTRLEGQELRQLAEYAVPGYEAVYDKIYVNLAKKTGKSIGQMKFTMIDSATAIETLVEVMEEHFGGAAAKMAKTWSGMTIVLTNYFKEFVREIGSSGLFAGLEEQMSKFVKFLGDSFKSGEMQKLTKLISESLGVAFKDLFEFKLDVPKKSLGHFAGYFIETFIKVIEIVDILYRSLLGIKLVFQVIEHLVATFAVVLHSVLYGIMYILDKVIRGIIWAALKVPGLSKEATDSLKEQSKTSSELVIAARENISMSVQWWGSTVDGIEKTANAINDSANNAEDQINNMRKGLKAYNEEAAKPPKFAEPATPKFKYDERSLPMGPFPEVTYDEITTVNNLTNFIKHASIGQLIAYELRTGSEEGLKSILSKTKGFKGAIVKEFFAIVDAMKDSFSNVFQEIIKGNMNLMESFTAMGKVIREAMIKVSADIAAEWIKDQLRVLYNHLFVEEAKTEATVVGAAERTAANTASESESMLMTIANGLKFIAVQAYKAAAAMWAFFAGLGPFGWIAGGIAAGAAIATVMAFGKKIGSFETGTGLIGVRDTGPALLHKGEIVLNKKESDVFRDMANGGGQTSNVNLSFNISAMDGEDVERIVKKKIIPLLREDVRNFGKMRTTIKGVV